MDEDNYEREFDIDDAVEAFMKSDPKDAVKPSDEEDDLTEAVEAEDEDDTTDEDEGNEDDPDVDASDDDDVESDEGEGEDSKAADAPLAADEAEVVVSVDGKDHRVSVKDLKRLYGQEAALTQKSQALSAQKRAVEVQTGYVAKLLQDRYEAAKAKADRYKDVDLFRAARELEPEEFEALRSAKESAESEVVKLEQEGRQFLETAQTTRTTLLREQAKVALKEITDPSSRNHIPGWNDQLYGKLRTFAISQGMDADVVNEIVDPSAIKVIHMAMKYAEVQAAAPKVQKKIVKAPKRVVRKGDEPTDNQSSKLKAKRVTAMRSGDIDDVVDLFLAAARED